MKGYHPENIDTWGWLKASGKSYQSLLEHRLSPEFLEKHEVTYVAKDEVLQSGHVEVWLRANGEHFYLYNIGYTEAPRWQLSGHDKQGKWQRLTTSDENLQAALEEAFAYLTNRNSALPSMFAENERTRRTIENITTNTLTVEMYRDIYQQKADKAKANETAHPLEYALYEDMRDVLEGRTFQEATAWLEEGLRQTKAANRNGSQDIPLRILEAALLDLQRVQVEPTRTSLPRASQ